MKLLKRDPEERYKNVFEIKKDLENTFNENNNLISCSKNVKQEIYEKDWIESVIGFYKNSEYDNAELILRNQYENGNKSQDILYHMAYTYYKQGRFFDGLGTLKRIEISKVEGIRKNAFEDDLLYLNGRVLFELKKYDEAIKCYKKLKERNPENLDYRYKLACAYGLNNEQEEAVEIDLLSSSTLHSIFVVS